MTDLPTNATIDLVALLAPVSEANPAGTELDKFDSNGSYYTTKGARDTAFSTEETLYRAEQDNYSDEERKNLPSAPNWRQVVTSATETLTGESKDFRVACWMCESLIREEGYFGLRDGLALLQGLCQQYWENIYPVPNEDGHLDTVSVIAGINSQAAKRVLLFWPVTKIDAKKNPNAVDYSVYDYKQASGGEQGGNAALADIQAASAASPTGYYPNLIDAVQDSLASLSWLSDFLEKNCLRDSYGDATSPSLSSLREDLEQARRVITDGLASNHPDAETEDKDSEENIEIVDSVGSSQPTVVPGALRNREDALRSLSKVADFFKKTEPHSPVSYALRQVMSWGRMSLPELLLELISDQSTREDLQRRVGVPLDQEDSDS